MYNCQNRIKIIVVIGIGMLLGFPLQIFGFDLTNQIYSNFQKFYNKGISNDYLDSAYLSSYPKDPYGEALEDIDNMQMQLKVAGAKYIEDELRLNNCALSQKEIRGILYYFVPEFRAEIARKVKMKVGNSKSQDFVFDEDTIEKYCKKYFDCSHIVGYEKTILGMQKVKILAAKPGEIMTNCKEYFQSAYAKGNDNEKRVQNLKQSQAGTDKFRNASTDDSPYDIMSDFDNIGTLLYEESESPLTPVFYNLPVFSNSAKSLSNTKNNNYIGGDRSGVSGKNVVSGRTTSGSNNGRGSTGNTVKEIGLQLPNQGGSVNLGNKINGGGIQNNTDEDKSKVKNESKVDNTGNIVDSNVSISSGVIVDVIDDLIDGLGTTSIANKGTLFYGSLCNDDEIEIEPEGDNEQERNSTISVENDEGADEPILSTDEYQEMVDYMLSAVDQYVALSDETKQDISNRAANVGARNSATAPEDIDNAVEEIKECRQSCEGLRIDQKASCQIMCACGEWTSSEWGLFDPNDKPGLGPILMIRYCTVPAVDTRFSIGGRRIVSIEEGVKEILGVTDKLSREGKLGIWTQQNNFLDSSTKKMKFYDAIAFSIGVEYVNLRDTPSQASQQYAEMNLEKNNKSWQASYGISNQLNNPSKKNKFLIVGAETLGQSNSALNDVVFLVDQIEDSHADRYVSISEDLDNYLDQHGSLREQIKTYLQDMYDNAKALYSKKK